MDELCAYSLLSGEKCTINEYKNLEELAMKIGKRFTLELRIKDEIKNAVPGKIMPALPSICKDMYENRRSTGRYKCSKFVDHSTRTTSTNELPNSSWNCVQV